MPDYSKQQNQPCNSHADEFMRAMFSGQPETEKALASDVRKLLDAITALRAELAVAPSLIATGREVVDEFRRLRDVHRG